VKLFRAGEGGFEKYLLEVERRWTREGFHLEEGVQAILNHVRKKGDKALFHYSHFFDGIRVPVEQLQVKPAEIKEAYRRISSQFLKTLEVATRRIQRFHRLPKGPLAVVREQGIVLREWNRPLERVGIYIPGGKAAYPSTVLMAAIPAKAAGVSEILMVTPPQRDGIHPAVLVAADLAGVDRIYKVGGAQAIGALAYGTESIPKVDKIVGPGNRYVAMAKKLVYGVVNVDMVAGPSEIVIVSDGEEPPSFIAADLISQAEHDEMALAILITFSEEFGKKVEREVKRQLSSLKRKGIAQKSLNMRGAILVVNRMDHAVEIVNRIAPEHLELCISNPFLLAKRIRHAGAIFLGPYTPEAIGDYLAGPNHILPTAGTARFSSPLGVSDFMKRTNLLSFTRNALSGFEKDVKGFAECEGLEGHYRAVQVRMEKNEKTSKVRDSA
jgi:histidinol dehydrogenase